MSSLHQIEQALAVGDVASAEDDCLALLAGEPNNPDLIALLALCDEARNQPDRALARLERIRLEHPDNPRAHFHAGRLLLAQGALGEAEEALLVAVTLAPNHAPSRHLLGRIAFRGGRPDVAIERFKTALKADARYLPAHCDLALALIDCGDPDAALDAASQAVKLDGTVAEAHLAMGAVWLAQADWEPARTHLVKATDLDPDSTQGLLMLAKAHQMSHEHDQALATLDRLSGTDKARLDARHARALSLLQLGQTRLAQALWEEMVAELPQVDSVVQLVDVCLHHNDVEALERVQRQLHQSETVPPELEGFVDAVCRAMGDDRPEALENFQDLSVATSDPVALRAALWVATLWLERNDSAQALSALGRLQARHSPPPAVGLQMAQMAAQAGDVDFALGCLDQALSFESLPGSLEKEIRVLHARLTG
ncbi:MAG: tetratricopeptide repeat protein [Wenzhouxiangella sp.]|nr:tetratricopeptide repeat protein [Wenzhouxiangella sp.]